MQHLCRYQQEMVHGEKKKDIHKEESHTTEEKKRHIKKQQQNNKKKMSRRPPICLYTNESHGQTGKSVQKNGAPYKYTTSYNTHTRIRD